MPRGINLQGSAGGKAVLPAPACSGGWVAEHALAMQGRDGCLAPGPGRRSQGELQSQLDHRGEEGSRLLAMNWRHRVWGQHVVSSRIVDLFYSGLALNLSVLGQKPIRYDQLPVFSILSSFTQFWERWGTYTHEGRLPESANTLP